MFLIVTRNFPPDIGGMQVLMGGLTENLLNHGPVKVFTYEYENSNIYADIVQQDNGDKAFWLRYENSAFKMQFKTGDGIKSVIIDVNKK